MGILNFECTPKIQHRNAEGKLFLPQYFVVTPKLLPRLEYSPCSSVFVIFNGPFQMPQEYWKLNKFVKSQKTLSQALTQEEDDEDDESGSEEEDESGSEEEGSDETDEEEESD